MFRCIHSSNGTLAETISQNDPLLASTFDPVGSFAAFGSEAANLEYSILSAILGNPSPPDSTGSPPPAPSHAQYNWPAEPLDFTTSYASSYSDTQQLGMGSDSVEPTSPTTQYLNYNYAQPQQKEDPTQDQSGPLHPLQPRFPLDQRPRSPPAGPLTYEGDSSKGLLTPPLSNASPIAASAVPLGVSETARPETALPHLQSINDRVTKPYDYTEGYHFLMKHLPTRYVLSLSLLYR
jgi:hypothetical protein